MSRAVVIQGAGGGGKGGGGGGVSEDPNTLQSKSYARVLDLVSEGPIRGLVDGARSVYFDGVPLQNADGTYNFSDVVLHTRTGTQGQSHIGGFGAAENSIAVGVDVVADTPVVRTVTDPAVDAVRIITRFAALQEVTEKGKIRGTQVEYAIDLQSNGGGYVTQKTVTVRGKTTSVYERAHRIELTGAAPWDIRIRRITPDSTSSTLSNAFAWASYATIIDAKLRYPLSALVGLSIDSTQFQAIPTRVYDIEGISDFAIPSNYDPDTRVYTGIWDGTLVSGWTNNPAWVLYGLLTNPRWGLGRFVDGGQIDTAALYQIGRYCDEMVDDGAGGSEPRFTCNAWLASRQEAWRLLDDLVSVFRGMHYWGAGSVMFSQDAPSDPVFRFTNANVEGGVFAYEGASLRTQFTVAVAYYQDPADFGRRRPVRVQDDDLVAQRGIIVKEIEAVACTSRGQAIRLCRAVLAASKLETELVQFRPGLEGAFVRPGNVIEIADSKRAGVRMGGRITASTTTSVTLDAPVTLVAGQTYTLTIIERQDAPIVRTVTTPAGDTSVLSWGDALPDAPAPMSVWLLGSDAVQPKQYRVVAMAEPETFRFQVSALEYTPAKYDYIGSGGTIQDGPVTSLYATLPAPADLSGYEAVYISGSTSSMQAVFSWQPVDGAVRYHAQLDVDDDNPILYETGLPNLQVLDADPGEYTLTVRAINAAGKRGMPASLTIQLDGVADPPPGLDNFGLAVQGSEARLSWTQPSSVLVTSGGNVVVAYFAGAVATATWNAATVLGTFAGSSTGGTVPLLEGTYLGRTRDFSGTMSEDVAYVEYGTGGGGGGGVLALTATATSIHTGTTSSSATSSSFVTASASGGTTPYSYAWTRTSGDTRITATSPASRTTAFHVAGIAYVGETVSATFACTVTDDLGATASVSVAVSFTQRSSNTSGGDGVIP